MQQNVTRLTTVLDILAAALGILGTIVLMAVWVGRIDAKVENVDIRMDRTRERILKVESDISEIKQSAARTETMVEFMAKKNGFQK